MVQEKYGYLSKISSHLKSKSSQKHETYDKILIEYIGIKIAKIAHRFEC